MVSLPPFEQRSSLLGLQKPLIKNWAVGNESSAFVSESSNRSRLGLISEHKKSNLFRTGLMFSCPIISRFWFFSLILVRGFKFLFSGWSKVLFIEVGISESNTKGCSGSILFSFMIPGHPFAFQKLFIELKRFLARRLVPVGFRCKPLLPRFLALIFLLSIMSISS